MKRGDIVLVHVPFVGSAGGKIRPAVVVQNDALNAVIQETVIAEITSNLSNTAKPHQVMIDISTPDGAATGGSAVRCERLHTIPQSDVRRTIGSLSLRISSEVDAAMKSALGLS
jgi:mRNA-degrading endonuclease toxin of MazEF toxin-antitoxin module